MFLRGNYLSAELGSGHDAALLIYEDYSALSPGQRAPLLSRVFWNWMHCLSPQEVAAELAAGGFEEPMFFGDVTGARFDPSGSTFAAVARVAGENGAPHRETPAAG